MHKYSYMRVEEGADGIQQKAPHLLVQTQNPGGVEGISSAFQASPYAQSCLKEA